MLFDYNKHDDYEPKERDHRHPRFKGKIWDFVFNVVGVIIALSLIWQLGEWIVSLFQ